MALAIALFVDASVELASSDDRPDERGPRGTVSRRISRGLRRHGDGLSRHRRATPPRRRAQGDEPRIRREHRARPIPPRDSRHRGPIHPHLLALYDSGEIDDLLFYVMPFVDGMSLRQRMRAEGPLPLEDVRKILREASEALSFAHARGIVHRDIKPENILLASYSPNATRTSWNTLVADFGISALTATAHDHLTATGITVGSPQYMSPEQAVGAPVDARTDIWALGCIAFEMLEGSASRGAPTFRRAGVPVALHAAVVKALSQDLEKRFTNATDFADAADASFERERGGGARRARWIAGTAAAVALIAVLGSMIFNRATPVAPRPITRDSIALARFRQGQASAATRDPANLARSLDDFSAAIARDSGFALAWSALAVTAQFMATRGFNARGRSRDSLGKLAVNASERALSLDSSRAEVWLARARVMELVDPTTVVEALRDVRHALAIDSTNAQAWLQLGRNSEENLDTAGARAGYEHGLRYSPRLAEILAFYALHGVWVRQPREGLKWADSAIAVDPTYILAREAAGLNATELRDWSLAERHLSALEKIATGPDRVTALGHRARLEALRGNHALALQLARTAERLIDSTVLTRHEAAHVAEAFSAAGDTVRALHWLEAFQPRADAHYQLHLHRDPALAWLHDPRYRHLLMEPAGASARPQ